MCLPVPWGKWQARFRGACICERGETVTRGVVALAWLVLVVATVQAIGGAPKAQWQGQQGTHTGPARVVVRDAAAWQTLWDRIGRAPPRPFPRQGLAVAVLAERQPTAGYDIAVSITPNADNVIVTSCVRQPDGPAAQVLTRPWRVDLLVGAGPDREVTFQRCGGE